MFEGLLVYAIMGSSSHSLFLPEWTLAGQDGEGHWGCSVVHKASTVVKQIFCFLQIVNQNAKSVCLYYCNLNNMFITFGHHALKLGKSQK